MLPEILKIHKISRVAISGRKVEQDFSFIKLVQKGSLKQYKHIYEKNICVGFFTRQKSLYLAFELTKL